MEKKERGDQTKGIEFPHFSNTLKLHALHTHTTKKHFKSCPNLCKLLAECVFLFVFFSLRIVTLTGTRRAILFLEKMGIIIYCLRVSAKIASKSIDSKKREILTRTRRRYIFQNAFKTDRNAFLDVFFARFVRIYSEYDFARRNTRAEKSGIVRKRRFFVFRECNPRQHLEALWTRFFKKKEKKNSNPFTSSFSHTKNIIYDS